MVRNRKRPGVRYQIWLVLLVLKVVNVTTQLPRGLHGHRVVGFISESDSRKFNIDRLEDVATWADEIR
jgi:hypothetical protein